MGTRVQDLEERMRFVLRETRISSWHTFGDIPTTISLCFGMKRPTGQLFEKKALSALLFDMIVMPFSGFRFTALSRSARRIVMLDELLCHYTSSRPLRRR